MDGEADAVWAWSAEQEEGGVHADSGPGDGLHSSVNSRDSTMCEQNEKSILGTMDEQGSILGIHDHRYKIKPWCFFSAMYEAGITVWIRT